ncbi:MAG: terminase small subunit [Mucilaginibacter sp.]|uniref:terminase small subunit n=1 Tax=Mucilaginibacter sp. TaxID=1882438 RepID=UPI003265098E
MIQVTPNLNDQQIRFCDEYLVSFNAYKSAISAGYSDNTARKGEILHTPKIQEYLRLKMQQRSERMEITHDMILREYAKIAFSSMANYYDTQGNIKPVCELTDTEMAAISFFETRNIAEPDGYIVGAVSRIKLHNKMAALDKIARHLGFFGSQNQEARIKNQDEDKVIQESRTRNQEEEKVAASVEQEQEEDLSVNADGALDFVDGNVVADAGEKVLTLSPLYAVSDCGEEYVAAGADVDGLMAELLLRGTDD